MQVPLHSMPPPVLDVPIEAEADPASGQSDSESDSSEGDILPDHPFDKLDSEPTDDGMMSELESTLLILDWMTSHKATEESVQDIHLMLQTARPDAKVPSYHTIRGILKSYQKKSMERVEICVNDCLAYWNAPVMDGWPPYRHAHLRAFGRL